MISAMARQTFFHKRKFSFILNVCRNVISCKGIMIKFFAFHFDVILCRERKVCPATARTGELPPRFKGKGEEGKGRKR
jgi:hypothetical protein